MIRHTDFEDSYSGKVKRCQLIKTGQITLGGNLDLKIYGRLQCHWKANLERVGGISGLENL